MVLFSSIEIFYFVSSVMRPKGIVPLAPHEIALPRRLHQLCEAPANIVALVTYQAKIFSQTNKNIQGGDETTHTHKKEKENEVSLIQ